MTKRIFALLLAVLTMFSAVSPAYAAEAGDTEIISCTNSQECQANEHSEKCCVRLGCAETHLPECLHYITVDSCSLCTGTVENHALDCVTFCTKQEDCSAAAHYDDCGSTAAPHAEGCAAEGCELAADHSGLHSYQEKCAVEGCQLEAGHSEACSNAEPEAPALSEQAQSVVALLEALPAADSISVDELSDEEWEQQMDTLSTAMDAYNALGAEDVQTVNEQYEALVRNALALNDALVGQESTTYDYIKYSNSWGSSNVTITLTDQFDYPANDATITVTSSSGNEHEVRSLGNGRYAFTKQGNNSTTYTIQIGGKYAEKTATVKGSSSSTSVTVEALGEYWLDFRLYYYIEQDFFPSTYGGYGDPSHYGPSGDDTPFIIIPVDVNKLREIADDSDAVVFRPDPGNTNQWEFTPAGNTRPKDTALANTKAFWEQVLTCVSEESIAALYNTGVGKVFYGYSLKKQEASSLHIDGVLDAKLPVYIIELYDNNVYFREFYQDSAVSNNEEDYAPMREVLAAFKARLGLGANVTINWQAQANDRYTGTYIANNRLYTVTVSRINSNKNHGEQIKNGVRYYSQSSDDSYYLAKFNMTVDAGKPLNTVTYQWKVYGTDGQETSLPAGAFGVPAPVTGLEDGTNFEYNKGFTNETSYPDYENGILYTFSGWTNYANISTFAREADATHTAITGETVPITGNTWINGYWSATPLEPADAHILLEKKVVVAEGGDETYVKNYLSEIGRMFMTIETHADKDNDGKTFIDADYKMITAAGGHRVDVYVFDKPFEFTEKQADVPGYTLTTEVKVEGSHVQRVTDNSGVVKVDMDAATGNLGTVTFTNTYTKIEGDAVNEYPTLELYKFAGDTSEPMSGVTFTLTKGTTVKTATTDADGVLNFGKIEAGEYFLKEVDVPEGYRLCEHHGANGYTVKVESAEPVEELRDGKFIQVNYHTLQISEDGTCDHINLIEPLTAEAAEENTYALRISNEPVLGTVTFKKSFSGAASADYNKVFMQLHFHGPIARNAAQEIVSIGTNHVVELTAEKNWQATVSDLPLGEYLVHEPLYDIHGYTWLGATYNGAAPTTLYNGNYYYLVTIAQGENAASDPEITLNVTNKYDNWDAATLAVYKVTAGNPRTPLSGAKFTLYSDAACHTAVATYETGDDGVVRFGNLTVPQGDTDGIAEFYLKETKAPNGYYLSQEVWKVEVKLVNNAYETKVTRKAEDEWVETSAFSQADDMLTVTNTPVRGRLNIKKTFIGEMPEGIQEIRVQVLSQGGTDYGTYVLNEAGNWSVTVTNLPMGTYTVRETAYNVPGYDLVPSSSITSVNNVTLRDTTGLIINTNNGPVADVELKNEYQRNDRFVETYASFSVLKVDSETNRPLKDAVFTLYEGEGTTGRVIATLYTTESGKVTFSNLHGTIGSDGNPKDGIYTLAETAAPVGYVKTDTQWKVTVEENDGEYRIVLNEQGNFFENIWDWIIGGITNSTGDLTDGVLTVKNDRAKYSMTIRKNFTEDSAELTELPTNAHVELLVTGPNHYSKTIKLDGNVDTGADVVETTPWTATLSNLELGEYTVKETMASLHGHTWLGATIDVNGTQKVNATTEGAVQYTFTVTDRDSTGANVIKVSNGDTVAVAVENNYKVWEAVDFYVQKVDALDSTILLDDVTFQLYDEAGNKLEQEERTFTTSAKTDASGIAHFTGFTVPEGQTSVTYVLKEKAAHADYIQCTDVWEVTITHKQNQYDISITNTTNGTFDSAIDRLTVKNTPIKDGSLQIKKVFDGIEEEAHKSGTEIEIQVTGPYNYYKTITLDGTTDTVETAPWTATLSDLRMGVYTIQEISGKVPGYELIGTAYAEGNSTARAGEEDSNAAKSIAVTLNSSNKAKEVTITNTYVQKMNSEPVVSPASFQILKVDSRNDQPLKGAVFGLFSENGTTAEITATTNENGIAEFTGLVGDAQNPENEVIYTLKEITAPSGYLKTEQEWRVVVTEKDGQVEVKLHEEKDHYDSIWEWIVNVFNPDAGESNPIEGTLKVANTPTKLTLNKVENWYLDGQLTDLDAIEVFMEEEIPERKYTFQIEWQVGGTTYNVHREITLDELTNGSVVVEGVIPEGAAYKVTELTHGERDFIVTYGAGCEGVIGTDSSATVTNSYHYNHVDPENGDKELTDQDSGKLSVRLNLLKMDVEADKVLKGAKFELRHGDQKVGEATSDENGQLSFVITEAGEYELAEVQAPDGYSVLPASITVTVAESDPYTTTEVVNNTNVTVTHVKLEIQSIGNLTQEDGSYVVDNDPLVDLTVNKVWDDGDYHKRRTYVQVKLLKDGVEAEGYNHLTLSKKNNWTAAWTGLDANADWSVEEVALGDHYVATYSVKTSGNQIHVTVKNTREAQPIDITVKKVWRGGEGSSVRVNLYGNGKLIETVKITAASGWKHTWKNLPDNVEYKVDEVKMEGYFKKVTHDASGKNWVITNTVSVIPATGDTILVAVGVMAISAAALVILLAVSKKRKKNK